VEAELQSELDLHLAQLTKQYLATGMDESAAVARRTGEIGLRLALGATSAGVLRLILKESMLLAGAGIVVGALAAVAAHA
jgi:hypothetical protein